MKKIRRSSSSDMMLMFLLIMMGLMAWTPITIHTVNRLKKKRACTVRARALEKQIPQETIELNEELAKMQDAGYRIDARSSVLRDAYVLYSHMDELKKMRSEYPELFIKEE